MALVKIRERKTSAGTTLYLLDYGKIDGKRKRTLFSTLAEAEDALDAALGTKQRLGDAGLSISRAQMADYLANVARLEAIGATMAEAVDFFIRHGGKISSPKLVPDLVEDFVWSRTEAGRSARTVQTYRSTLRTLGRAFPHRKAHELTRADIQAWIKQQGWPAAKTINGAVGHASSLFAWAIAHGHASHNPCDGIESRAEHSEEIGTLTFEQAERLLKAALKEPRMMPYVALGLFCGIRRAELERLRWSEINFTERTVIITARKAKTRQRRVVDIPENAVAWIEAAGWTAEERVAEKRPTPANLKTLWPKFWPKSAVREWPDNALRHTFASMHYAYYQDEAKLQAQMGHESANMLHKHYRALKTKAEAAKFWKLKPPRSPAAARVLSMVDKGPSYKNANSTEGQDSASDNALKTNDGHASAKE